MPVVNVVTEANLFDALKSSLLKHGLEVCGQERAWFMWARQKLMGVVKRLDFNFLRLGNCVN